MAEIPADLASSVAGAPIQARELAKQREARRAGTADAARQQIKQVGDMDTTVEAGDADTAVFAEAEGSGSQGRSEEEPAVEESASGQPPQGDVTTDEDGQVHLDIEA